MNRKRFFPVLILFFGITSACSSPMKNPDIKMNPNPKFRYEFTVSIDGAPGPFDSITSSAQYQVMNPNCVPMQPGSGATPTISKSIPIVLERESDKLYKGSFETDAFEDENYFGLGVCRWQLIAADAVLSNKKVSMTPSLLPKDIQARKSVTTYFSNDSYQNIGMEGVDTGNDKREAFGARSNQTFSVTLTAKEKVQ